MASQALDTPSPDAPGRTGGATGVRIENLGLAFGDNEVLKGIDLEIRPGEFFAFLGPSGSGKSTLLRAIAGFGPTPTGRILIDGEDVAALPPWKRNVGMVFQSYALWPHMSVFRNVAFGLEERGLPREEIRTRTLRALELVGLADYAERRPSQLSGGQQQRVALARTVVIEPRVLLLDEPLSNLDANLRIQMRHEILELQRSLKLTTIFVTHDQEEANTTSDRMAVLDQGVIQQVGTPVHLYDNPENIFVARFLGSANVLEGGLAEEGGNAVFHTKNGLSLKLPIKPETKQARYMVFRPQDLVLATSEEAAAAAGEARLQLSGTVRQREFLGHIVRYKIDIDGNSIFFDESHHKGMVPLEDRQPVELLLPGSRITFLDK